MTRKQELERLIQSRDAAQVELWEIEKQEAEERNRSLIGKCFKYRNSYSCPQEDKDYWWMYMKVSGVSGTSLRVWRFQTDKYGKVDIEPDTMFSQEMIHIGRHEIPLAEFDAAWREIMERLERL